MTGPAPPDRPDADWLDADGPNPDRPNADGPNRDRPDPHRSPARWPTVHRPADRGPAGRRALLGLGLAAVLSVAAAVAVWRERPPPPPGAAAGPVLPALAEAVAAAPPGEPAAAVERVEVRDSAGGFAVERRADGWRLPALAGYRADPAVVARLVAQLAALEKAAALTRRPDRFALLGLAPVGAAEGAARARLTLYAPDGAVRGDLLVGHARPGGVDGRDGVYVRQPPAPPPAAAAATDASTAPVSPAARAWLAAGALDLPRTPVDWADRVVLDLAPERLSRLTITRADAGRRLAIVPAGDRAGGSDAAGNPVGAFRLADPPAGRRVERPFRIDNLAEALDDLRLTAVRRAGRLDGVPVFAQAQATTADGLVVTLTLRRDPDDPAVPWLTVDAGAAPGAAPGVAEEAAAITGHTARWEYRVPAHRADRLAATVDGVTAPHRAGGVD